MPISASNVPENRQFERELDPNGMLDYTCDWSTMLGSETISSVTTTLSSLATAAGLEIVSEANDTTTATVRLKVNAANQSDPEFTPPGTDFTFKQTVTDSTGQIMEYSFLVRVVQQ